MQAGRPDVPIAARLGCPHAHLQADAPTSLCRSGRCHLAWSASLLPRSTANSDADAVRRHRAGSGRDAHADPLRLAPPRRAADVLHHVHAHRDADAARLPHVPPQDDADAPCPRHSPFRRDEDPANRSCPSTSCRSHRALDRPGSCPADARQTRFPQSDHGLPPRALVRHLALDESPRHPLGVDLRRHNRRPASLASVDADLAGPRRVRPGLLGVRRSRSSLRSADPEIECEPSVFQSVRLW